MYAFTKTMKYYASYIHTLTLQAFKHLSSFGIFGNRFEFTQNRLVKDSFPLINLFFFGNRPIRMQGYISDQSRISHLNKCSFTYILRRKIIIPFQNEQIYRYVDNDLHTYNLNLLFLNKIKPLSLDLILLSSFTCL